MIYGGRSMRWAVRRAYNRKYWNPADTSGGVQSAEGNPMRFHSPIGNKFTSTIV